MGDEIQLSDSMKARVAQTLGDDHGLAPEEQVEFLADRNWNVLQICRQTGYSRDRVNAILDAIDERKIREVSASPGRRKARYVSRNEAVQDFVWRRAEQTGNVRLLSIALAAQQQTIKVMGDYAPTQTVNVEWKAHALVNPEVQARIMADPQARAALLALEEFAAGHQVPAGPPEGGAG